MVYNKDKIICKYYIFQTHRCIEDNSFCSYGYPVCMKHCNNGKYEPFFLPEGYAELVIESLRASESEVI